MLIQILISILIQITSIEISSALKLLYVISYSLCRIFSTLHFEIQFEIFEFRGESNILPFKNLRTNITFASQSTKNRVTGPRINKPVIKYTCNLKILLSAINTIYQK